MKLNECRHCGWRIRPRGGLSADYPGTHVFGTKTECQNCVRRIAAGIPLPGNDYECARCHRQVDTGYEGPKSIQPSSGGVCRTCKSAMGQQSYRRECEACGVVMVSRSIRPAPGERRHAAHGLCNSCYQKSNEKRPQPVVDEFTKQRRARAERRAMAERAKMLDYARRQMVKRRGL